MLSAHDRENRYQKINANTLKQSLKKRKLVPQDLLPEPEVEENDNTAQHSPLPSETLTASPSSSTRSDPDASVDDDPLELTNITTTYKCK